MNEQKENEDVPKEERVEIKQSGNSILITPKWALIGDELMLTNIDHKRRILDSKTKTRFILTRNFVSSMF